MVRPTGGDAMRNDRGAQPAQYLIQAMANFVTLLGSFVISLIFVSGAVAQAPEIFGGHVEQSGASLSGLILPARDMVALDNDGNLWRRPGASGLNFKKETPVRGVLGQLIGIDYRPADGRLYGLDDLGNLYTIDLSRPNFAIALLVSSLT